MYLLPLPEVVYLTNRSDEYHRSSDLVELQFLKPFGTVKEAK